MSTGQPRADELTSSSSYPVSVTLSAVDIPGADLSEPWESHALPALRWWLLCRGVKAPTGWRKQQLVEMIRQAIKDNTEVVDVDGSYLYKKRKRLEDADFMVSPLEVLSAPVSGWEHLTEANASDLATKLPCVTAGEIYMYLSTNAGRQSGEGTFRALTRGYTHWESGRIDRVEVNNHNPEYCHIRSNMKPSMKPGSYNVWILLGWVGCFATIQRATCECAAGKSASCTHVSALLHAMVSLTVPQFQLQPADLPGASCSVEDSVPVISLPCQWKAPKKRKESSMTMAEAPFVKHVYSRERKRKVVPVEDFDPRPAHFRGTACDRLPSLLKKVRGEHLCISLLFDEHFRHWDCSTVSATDPTLPDKTALRSSVEAFKTSLMMPAEAIRKIECDTKEQRKSPLWHEVRRYRVTASKFGAILRRQPDTPPTNLVLSILQPKQFTSAATDWGIQNEQSAIRQYLRHQQSQGHPQLTVAPCGFCVCQTHPYLGASPDGAVYDPSTPSVPFGFLEVKCPYTHRNITPEAACSTAGFCCSLEVNADGRQRLVLRINHPYYAQVQGEMAIGDRQWCDFVLYTTKGISVQQIVFDQQYWDNQLLPKLTEFYDNCLGPEIVSPIHVLGLPVRNLNK